MSGHDSQRASERETRNGEQTYSVRQGVSGDGAVIARGDLLDMLWLNRTRHGQSRVWSDSGRAMTFPKVPWWRSIRLAEVEMVAKGAA